jgi:hypothetical protein
MGDHDYDGNYTGVTLNYVSRYITSLYWAVTTMATVGYGA